MFRVGVEKHHKGFEINEEHPCFIRSFTNMSLNRALISQYIQFFDSISKEQFTCIINTLTTEQTKIIIEIVYNVLYNNQITLSPIHKKLLKPQKEVLEQIADIKISTSFKRDILIPKNHLFVGKTLKIAHQVNAIHEILFD